MAAKKRACDTSSLAAELLHKISPMPYKTYVSKFNECDAVTPDTYKNSRWANYFTIDSSSVVKNGRGNPNHVFDTFGVFSGHTGTEVRIKLLANIGENLAFYEKRSAVCLQMRSMNFEEWVHAIANETVYCDELGLMGLCFMYHRHSVVLTQNKLWSTVQADHPLNLLDLLNVCSVRLIYLGNLRFGVLTWRPRLPKKVATKSPVFNIIEEYTLDENTTTQGSTTRHVETNIVVKKCDDAKTVSSIVDPPRSEHVPTLCDIKVDAAAVKDSISFSKTTNTQFAATSSDTTSGSTKPEQTPLQTTSTTPTTQVDDGLLPPLPIPPVTCPEDGLILSSYPWKLKPKLLVEKLTPTEVDIWSNKVQEYYVHTPTKEKAPIVIDVRGYGLRSRPIKSEPDTPEPAKGNNKTEQLMDQAQALIDTAKRFVTKPVHGKHPRKRKRPHSSNDDEPKALDVLHNMTLNKLSTLHVETDGTARPSESVQPALKARKIRCRLCTEVFSTVRELNTHHRKDHGIVKCPKCERYFSTQSSLDRHSYSHGELKFSCDVCGKGFAFQSRLDQHMTVHISNKLSCPKKKCDKQFKNIWDLNRHMKCHTKGGWHYCDFCDYKNKDKRNTDSHMRIHSTDDDDKPYECEKCGKRMRFSTQFKRHKEQGC